MADMPRTHTLTTAVTVHASCCLITACPPYELVPRKSRTSASVVSICSSLRDMSRIAHDLDTAARNAGTELARVANRNQRVVLAPDDQRWRHQAVQALVKPFFRDRPDELACAPRAPTPCWKARHGRAGSGGGANMAFAAAHSGFLNSSAGSSDAGVVIQLAIGKSGRQSPIGSHSTTFPNSLGKQEPVPLPASRRTTARGPRAGPAIRVS